MPPGSLHVVRYLQFNMFQTELAFFFPNEISPGLLISADSFSFHWIFQTRSWTSFLSLPSLSHQEQAQKHETGRTRVPALSPRREHHAFLPLTVAASDVIAPTVQIRKLRLRVSMELPKDTLWQNLVSNPVGQNFSVCLSGPLFPAKFFKGWKDMLDWTELT